MVRCEVVNDSGDEHSELKRDVAAAVAEVAPLVEQVSTLTLGTHVVVRLVSPDDFARINARITKRLMKSVRPQGPKQSLTISVARILAPHALRKGLLRTWQDHVAQAFTNEDGGEEILLVPKVLQAMGAPPPLLRAVLAHELTHTAQHVLAPRSAGERLRRSVLRGLSGQQKHSDQALIEGHATWVCNQVTDHLYGKPITDLPGGEEGHGEYYRGRRFVEYVTDRDGLDLINFALENIEATPMRDEVDAPQSWIDRLKSGAS